MKQALGLIIGLLIGAAGALLFSKSMPPEEGSVEEQLEETKIELSKVRRTIREMERTGGRKRNPRTVGDGIRGVMQDLREGRDVSVDDLFATMKPWLRDMSPLFDRLREINGEDWADRMTGQWAREYNLTSAEEEQLREWFIQKNKEHGEAFNDVIHSDQSGFVDFIKATEYDWHDSEGVDEVMEGFLQGEELAKFQEERLNERVDSVQGEADRGVERLGRIVELDEQQQVEAFAILVRGSEDYREGEMAFDGMGANSNALNKRGRDAALRNIMRPEQVEVFDAHVTERRNKAEEEMRRLHLTLPDDWDLLEGNTF